MISLREDLRKTLNRHSAENGSGTPDYILAEFLTEVLKAWNEAVIKRAEWRDESVELPALQRQRSPERPDWPTSEYTPTLALARTIAGWDQESPNTRSIPHWAMNLATDLLESDWLDSYTAQVRAEVLRDAATVWNQGQWADVPRRDDLTQERIAVAQYVGDWLIDLSDREHSEEK